MSMFGNIMSSIFGGAAAGSPAAAGPAATGRAANPAATGAAASSPMATGATAASSTSASPQPGAGAPASVQARSGAASPPEQAPVQAPVQVPAQVDVAAVMDKLAEASPEDLDWRTSIVDMMKLLKLDSSLAARKQLASELAYTASTKDTAAMNVWLHKQVMIKLAENGGKVPSELKH
jgi:hypothetical protein